MSVVTLLPIANGFLLTTNRDELTGRPAASPPQTYQLNGQSLVFPKDPQGGGTWLAMSKTQLVCLINGAFPSDKPRLNNTSKKSRGLVVLDVFSYDDPYQFVNQYDFGGLDSFTMVIAKTTTASQHTVFELRWNGRQAWLRTLESRKPHIWSSFTMYDSGTIALRKIWFTQFLQENHNHYTPDTLFKFHRTAGNGNPARDYVMSRPAEGAQTVSIAQIAFTGQAATMRYLDLATMTETHLNH